MLSCSVALHSGFCHQNIITLVQKQYLLLSEENSLDVCLSSAQSLSRVWLFVTPWSTARQASLSITISQSLLKPMSIESVMASNHVILCRPLFLLPSTFPSIRVFSNESVLHIRWPKYWSFSFTISPSNLVILLLGFLCTLGCNSPQPENSF